MSKKTSAYLPIFSARIMIIDDDEYKYKYRTRLLISAFFFYMHELHIRGKYTHEIKNALISKRLRAEELLSEEK